MVRYGIALLIALGLVMLAYVSIEQLSKESLDQASYDHAMALLEQGDFEAARKIILDLGESPDTAVDLPKKVGVVSAPVSTADQMVFNVRRNPGTEVQVTDQLVAHLPGTSVNNGLAAAPLGQCQVLVEYSVQIQSGRLEAVEARIVQPDDAQNLTKSEMDSIRNRIAGRSPEDFSGSAWGTFALTRMGCLRESG